MGQGKSEGTHFKQFICRRERDSFQLVSVIPFIQVSETSDSFLFLFLFFSKWVTKKSVLESGIIKGIWNPLITKGRKYLSIRKLK